VSEMDCCVVDVLCVYNMYAADETRQSKALHCSGEMCGVHDARLLRS
jgi:hypothetical protein